jgi:hypothetical protein
MDAVAARGGADQAFHFGLARMPDGLEAFLRSRCATRHREV